MIQQKRTLTCMKLQLETKSALFHAPKLKWLACCCYAGAGDHIVTPFNLDAALGQALMHASNYPSASTSVLNAGLNRHVLGRITGAGAAVSRRVVGGVVGSGGQGSGSGGSLPFVGDFHEEHFVLPEGKVLLITNKRVIFLDAPGEQLQQQQCSVR